MANHVSALKRAKQNEIRRQRNRATRTRVKNAVKTVRSLAADPADADLRQALDSAKSTIDRAAKKGVIHQRTAARKISRLQRLIDAA